jgi:hypothetical protein
MMSVNRDGSIHYRYKGNPIGAHEEIDRCIFEARKGLKVGPAIAAKLVKSGPASVAVAPESPTIPLTVRGDAIVVPYARVLSLEVGDVAVERLDGVWYMLLVPKGTPANVKRHIHDAAKAAIEDSKFAADMTGRGIDVDYRPGEALRADLWREYQLHTDILRRVGMLKK